MPTPNKPTGSAQRLHLMDALLYLVAASAMIIISIAFLLWLRS